jgi:hypothetical protein
MFGTNIPLNMGKRFVNKPTGVGSRRSWWQLYFLGILSVFEKWWKIFARLAVGSKCNRDVWSFVDAGIDNGGKDGVTLENFIFKKRRSVGGDNIGWTVSLTNRYT